MTVDIFVDHTDGDQTTNGPKRSTATWPRILLVLLIGYIALTWTQKQPEPQPDPIDAKGFRVLVVEETERRAELSQGQHLALFSTNVRDWLDNNCVKENDQPARLFVDSETDLRPYGDAWVSMRKYATPPYPCIVVSNPPNVIRQDIRRDIDPQRLIDMLERAKSKSRSTQPNKLPKEISNESLQK